MRKGEVTESHNVIPVISLKANNVIVSGNGTANKPYKVQMAKSEE